jgi:hypothetical protein
MGAVSGQAPGSRLPMPLAAPVTIATLPANSRGAGFSFNLYCSERNTRWQMLRRH